MIKLIAMLFTLFATNVYADRITEMFPMEECQYRARLAAGASWLRIQKMADSCETLKIFWHGDETEYELSYVKEWMCEGFKLNLDPIKTGDLIYINCMKSVK